MTPEMPEIDSKGESAPIRVIFYVISVRELLICQITNGMRVTFFKIKAS